MRRGDWAIAPEVLMAASNDGVIAVRELERLGVPESTTYRRCRDGELWQRLGPGIAALHNGTATWRQQLIAALLHGGGDALITGAAALRLHGMQAGDPPTRAHLLIPHSQQVRSWGIFHVERTSRMPRGVERDGLPVAPLGRAVLDEVRLHKDPKVIATIVAEPVRRRLLVPAQLLEELDAGCRKGSAAPRAVLHAIEAGARSAAEFDAREWWLAQPDLPGARFNVAVCDPTGRQVGIVDVLVEDVGFAWEIDSVEHHFATPDQVEATLRRQRALRAVGLHLVSTRPSQLRDDPDGTLRDVVDGLAVASALPAAQTTYVDDIPRRV